MKHSRSDGDVGEMPLQMSIKKMRLDSDDGINSLRNEQLIETGRTSTHRSVGSSEDEHLRAMNQLLGFLHSLRIERKATAVGTNAGVRVVSPHTYNAEEMSEHDGGVGIEGSSIT
jgi:hypothetical protein